MGNSTWCYAHKRMEEDTDYIDYEVSPTFLGAAYEQGLTQRRPAEMVNPPTPMQVADLEKGYPIRGDDAYLAEMFQGLRDEIKTLRNELRELKTSPVQRRGVVQQREIDISGD